MIRMLMMASLVSAAPALAQEHVTLKPGPGLDVVTAACSSCHTLNYIKMNSPFLAPEVWKAEVSKMQKVFGAPIDDDAAASVVKYLSAAYGTPAKP